MPTVLSNVNELIDRNMVIEIGEYESTGGRKAKRIGINPAYKYAVGVVITANHLGIVLLNMQYEIEKTIRMRLKFSTETSYCLKVAEMVEDFLKDVEDREKILGIGISIPGRIRSRGNTAGADSGSENNRSCIRKAADCRICRKIDRTR